MTADLTETPKWLWFNHKFPLVHRVLDFRFAFSFLCLHNYRPGKPGELFGRRARFQSRSNLVQVSETCGLVRLLINRVLVQTDIQENKGNYRGESLRRMAITELQNCNCPLVLYLKNKCLNDQTMSKIEQRWLTIILMFIILLSKRSSKCSSNKMIAGITAR